MSFEVELKFPVAQADRFLQHLTNLKARELETVEQHDEYFRHPQRDFARTDEALRIRRVGEQSLLTYKGPKIDSTTKTRREIELPFGNTPQASEQLGELLRLLGFESALVVSKTRRQFEVTWRDQQVEATLDVVEGLGTFAELEVVAEEAGVAAARELIISLAEHCELGKPELRGYADLLQSQQ